MAQFIKRIIREEPSFKEMKEFEAFISAFKRTLFYEQAHLCNIAIEEGFKEDVPYSKQVLKIQERTFG